MAKVLPQNSLPALLRQHQPNMLLLLQYGLIAGGLADGSVCVWNPARIIGQKAEAKPTSPAATRGQLLARLQKHQGAVRGLEFNSFRWVWSVLLNCSAV